MSFAGISIAGVLISSLWSAVQDAREAARRTHCRSNLCQIGLALHNYHDVYGVFPPAHTVDDQGNAMHSWRTLVLPFMDQNQLYETIDLSKPWHDAQNAEARRALVPCYHCPSTTIPGSHTTYVAIAGEGRCFPSDGSRHLKEITDGTANTLMVIEVSPNQAVHWMEPRDDDGTFLVNLRPDSASVHSGAAAGLFADGSVRVLNTDIPASERRAMLTVAGNEDSD